MPPTTLRLPEWLRHPGPISEGDATRRAMRDRGVVTVCEEARCPNKSQCYSKPTAAFMILGDRCQRRCGFCSVTQAFPLPPDPLEPERIAGAALSMALQHVVITSVTRDDLADGGAAHFAATIAAVKSSLPWAKIEILVPDFLGNEGSIRTVLDARPDVFNHNIETVSRLYATVRPGASYERSLQVLGMAKSIAPGVLTKSGLMLGLGEGLDEVHGALEDLRAHGCDMLTVGQYLRPTRRNLAVALYVAPETFEDIRTEALRMGFRSVISSALARSSMHAKEMYYATQGVTSHV